MNFLEKLKNLAVAPNLEQRTVVSKHPVKCNAETWGGVVKDDFIKMFCGPLIATGTSRSVYELIGQPSLVVKVELTEGTFQNISEWHTWTNVQFTPWAAYLAPCRRISPCGHVLIQERTTPLAVVPKELPDFLEDLKKQNFGSLQGKVVCHDYALTAIDVRGILEAKMREVNVTEWDQDIPG